MTKAFADTRDLVSRHRRAHPAAANQNAALEAALDDRRCHKFRKIRVVIIRLRRAWRIYAHRLMPEALGLIDGHVVQGEPGMVCAHCYSHVTKLPEPRQFSPATPWLL